MKHNKHFSACLITLFISLPFIAQAEQRISEEVKIRSNQKLEKQSQQNRLAKIADKTSHPESQEQNTANTDRYIIECRNNKTGMISRNQQARGRGSVAAIDKTRVEEALRVLKTTIHSINSLSDNDRVAASQVVKEFKLSFCGVAASLSSSAKEDLIRQGYKVHSDKKFHATLSESVPEIGADQAWKSRPNMSLRGEGVKVAIIDTGIDYSHTDFGSCKRFRGCPRIGGGYDFVNGDNDPFDDHGHGTHVAGIVGGNGKFPGVAPASTFYIYKVLDSEGSGYESEIIAALEASIDPNGDLNTSDHLDVINLSLGGYGDPDDSLSFAVDSAFYAGVLPVVAAGNDGPDIKTIGSPGLARKALSVAAGRKTRSFIGEEEFSVAEFSSRGPVIWNDTILVKPDILAPGVSICSALSSRHTDYWSANCVDKAHIKLSGTSMAAPHVAGAAALVKQAHPEWGPGEIRAALLNSSERVPGSPSDKGIGKVNVLEAVRTSASPAEIELDPIQMESRSSVTITANLKARSGLKKYTIYRAPYDQLSEINSPLIKIDEGNLGGSLSHLLIRELSVPEKIGTPQYILLSVETMDGSVSTEIGAAWHDPIVWVYPSAAQSFGLNSEITFIVNVEPENTPVNFFYRRLNSNENWTQLPGSNWLPQNNIAPGGYEIKAEVVIEGQTVSESNILFIESEIPSSPGGYPVRPTNSFEGNRRFTLGTLGNNRDVVVSIFDSDPRDVPYIPAQHISIRNLSDGSLYTEKTLRAVSDTKFFPRPVFATTATGDKRIYILGDCDPAQPYNSACRVAAYSSNLNDFDNSWSYTPFTDASRAGTSSMAVAYDGRGDHSLIVSSLWGSNFPSDATGEIIVFNSSGNITARWFIPGQPERLGWYGSMFFSKLEPVLAQLDSDPELEIVHFSGEDLNTPDYDYRGKLHAYNQDGSELQSFPVDIDGLHNRGPMASADLNKDGIDEIILQTACLYSDSNCGALYVVSADGRILNKASQIELGSGPGSHSLGLADVNNDGIPEIMQCKESDPMHCTLRDSKLNLLPGWPKKISASQSGSYVTPINIVSGELDNVPGIDFVVGTEPRFFEFPFGRSWESSGSGYERSSLIMLRADGSRIENSISESDFMLTSVRLSPRLILFNALRSFSEYDQPLSGGLTAWRYPFNPTNLAVVEWEGTGNGETNTGRYITRPNR